MHGFAHLLLVQDASDSLAEGAACQEECCGGHQWHGQVAMVPSSWALAQYCRLPGVLQELLCTSVVRLDAGQAAPGFCVEQASLEGWRGLYR